jgi:hypothetical protein
MHLTHANTKFTILGQNKNKVTLQLKTCFMRFPPKDRNSCTHVKVKENSKKGSATFIQNATDQFWFPKVVPQNGHDGSTPSESKNGAMKLGN